MLVSAARQSRAKDRSSTVRGQALVRPSGPDLTIRVHRARFRLTLKGGGARNGNSVKEKMIWKAVLLVNFREARTGKSARFNADGFLRFASMDPFHWSSLKTDDARAARR